MASNLLKIQIQPLKIPTPRASSFPSNILFFPRSFTSPSTANHQHCLHVISIEPYHHFRTKSVFLTRSSLNPSAPKPPSSKEEAVSQARNSLTTTLQNPISNPRQLTSKLKKQKQPRFRVEIPVVDDSPDSITQLALQIFGDLPIKRKGSAVKTILIWPSPTLRESGIRAFEPLGSSSIEHADLETAMTVDNRNFKSADVVVFLAPEALQLAVMNVVCESIDPRPVVLFNPKWSFEEESDMGGLKSFVGSFEVVYAFLGLEVRGILSKRKGVVFKCVRDGILSGELWNVLVEEEKEGGDLRLVSKFKSRPSIVEVEIVLYNQMALNSPITKSVKFFKNLVSTATRKK